MIAAVIDTNVLVVANRAADHASPECIERSIDALMAIKDARVVALDIDGLILEEYLRRASLAGQPGVGDMFLSYLYDNLGNEKRCQRVHITLSDDGSFEEFPNDPELAGFDRSDRKFVAVALSCRPPAEVLYAVERGWSQHKRALEAHGLTITCLCPESEPATNTRRSGHRKAKGRK